MPTTVPRLAPEYRPFPDIPRRNYFQAAFEIPLLVRALGLPPGQRVLEVGCGRGVALPPLARLIRPSRLVGLDIDAGLVRIARERLKRHAIHASVECGDVRAMPFPGASFDLVIDFGTCHHISRPEQALREIVRVLAPGGVFVCETVSSQLLSHPIRTHGRRLPWSVVPELRTERDAVLWKARRKVTAS